MVFMYASHDQQQVLVGVGGSATFIDDESERTAIATTLKLDELAEDAWRLGSVRNAHQNNRQSFDAFWQQVVNSLPCWRCPADHFLWLNPPVPLHAKQITGKNKLLLEFHGYTKLTAPQAATILRSVANQQPSSNWAKLFSLISPQLSQDNDLPDDIKEIERQRALPETTKKALVDARIGQGKYQDSLERLWNGACAVTGCKIREILRASHIKAWKCATNEERLDAQNGLLLTANLDAAFERGLISFTENGNMLVSDRLSEAERTRLGIPRPLVKSPSAAQAEFLGFHRNYWGFPARH